MPYLGNIPAEAYSTFDKQTITGDGGTSYTLDQPVGSAQEVAIFVNNVRQEPGVAYTVSGTALTMTGDVESSDDFYAIFIGKAVQTVKSPEQNNDGSYTFSDDVTIDGTLDINGNELILDADGDTSITADTDDQLDFKTGGSNRMTIDGSGNFIFNEDGNDSDFRVESDNDTHVIFSDSSANDLRFFTSGSLAGNGGSDGITHLIDVLDADLKMHASTTPDSGRGPVIQLGDSSSEVGMTGALVFSENMRAGPSGCTMGIYYDGDTNKLHIVGADSTSTTDVGTNVTNAPKHVTINRTGGAVSIAGSLSKGSGSFKIDHPLKPDTHHLVHSFVEAPQADNIYRGTVDLVAGSATVNIDTVAGMTDGTFVALNREVQCFTSNESGWTAIKGSVSGNTLTITAQDNTCTDTVSWLVIGERKDQHMYDTEWTNDDGKVIVEPLKEAEPEEIDGEANNE